MAYYRGSILKRYARQLKAEQQGSCARVLSPLPELRELAPPHRPVSRLNERVGLIRENEESDKSARSGNAAPLYLIRQKDRRSRPHESTDKTRRTGAGDTSPRLKRLKKRRREAHRSCLVLSILLLTLFTLSGLLITGLYLTETTILTPLARFFHPIQGDASGSINGQA